jgi:hypothetical protein
MFVVILRPLPVVLRCGNVLPQNAAHTAHQSTIRGIVTAKNTASAVAHGGEFRIGGAETTANAARAGSCAPVDSLDSTLTHPDTTRREMDTHTQEVPRRATSRG